MTLYAYAEAVDSRDPNRIAELLTSEVQLTRAGGTVTGVAAFLEAYRPFLESDALGSRHVVTNVIVDEMEPGAVRVRACFEATLFNSSETRRVIGRYDDDLVHVDGGWIIAHKRNITEWAVDLPPATKF